MSGNSSDKKNPDVLTLQMNRITIKELLGNGEQDTNFKSKNKKTKNKDKEDMNNLEDYFTPIHTKKSKNKKQSNISPYVTEEEYLDPNSAFVSVAISKKRNNNSIMFEKNTITSSPKKNSQTWNQSIIIEAENLAIEGYKLANLEQYSEAADCFTKAIKLVNTDDRFYGNRSFCYCQIGLYQKALKDADKSISLAPKNPKGFFRRGEALKKLKRFVESEKEFRKVLQLDKNCEDAISELENIKIEQLMTIGLTQEQAYAGIQQYHSVEDTMQALVPLASKTNQEKDDSQCSLWIGNVTEEITEKDLIQLFSSYGVVVSVRLMSEKFCAFVNYLEANSAARALRELNGMLFGGNYLVIRYPNNPAPESLTSIKPRNNLNSNKKRIRN